MSGAHHSNWEILKNRPQVRTILKTISYFFSEKLLRMVVGFALQTWMARSLGPELFGSYAYITDFIAVFVPLVLFGADEILMRDLIENKVPTGRVIGTVLALRMATAAFSWLIVVLAISVVRLEDSLVLWGTILYGSILFIRVLDTFEVYFQAKLAVKNVAIIRQGTYIFSSGLKLWGIKAALGVPFFVASYFVEFLISRLLITLRFFREISWRTLSVDKEILRSLFIQCLPIALAAFMMIAENRSGIFFLNRFTTKDEVGQFAVAMGLVALWEFFPIMLCLSFFPFIVSGRQKSHALYHARMSALYALLFWLGMAVAVCLALFSGPVVRLLYGAEFDLTANILRWGGLLGAIAFVNIARVKWFIVERQTGAWLQICGIVLVLSLAFQWYLDPIYRHMGPVYASLLAHIIGNVLVCLWSPTIRQHNIMLLKAILMPWRWWKSDILIDQHQ